MSVQATQGGIILPVSVVDKITHSKNREGKEIMYATLQIGYGSIRLPVKDGVTIPEGWSGTAFMIIDNKTYNSRQQFRGQEPYDIMTFRPIQIVRFDKKEFVGVSSVFDSFGGPAATPTEDQPEPGKKFNK